MLNTLFNHFFKPSDLASVTPADLKKRLDEHEHLFVIDVRSPEEYRQDGHIQGARLLPLNLLAQRLNELPKDRPIVCVCRSGARSAMACETLKQHGFTNVINMSGGMMSWGMAGLPMAKPSR